MDDLLHAKLMFWQKADPVGNSATNDGTNKTGFTKSKFWNTIQKITNLSIAMTTQERYSNMCFGSLQQVRKYSGLYHPVSYNSTVERDI